MNIGSALGWHAQQLALHATTSGTYSDGVTSYTVRAARGRDRSKYHDTFGAVVNRRLSVFRIPADDLTITPKAGHTITLDGRRYEVRELPGVGAWEWGNEYHTFKRVYVQDVGAAT